MRTRPHPATESAAQLEHLFDRNILEDMVNYLHVAQRRAIIPVLRNARERYAHRRNEGNLQARGLDNAEIEAPRAYVHLCQEARQETSLYCTRKGHRTDVSRQNTPFAQNCIDSKQNKKVSPYAWTAFVKPSMNSQRFDTLRLVFLCTNYSLPYGNMSSSGISAGKVGRTRLQMYIPHGIAVPGKAGIAA